MCSVAPSSSFRDWNRQRCWNREIPYAGRLPLPAAFSGYEGFGALIGEGVIQLAPQHHAQIAGTKRR